jgi:hypothetical protein
MKKIILFIGLFCLRSTLFQLHAQSINNSNWKAFFGDPFNDTLTIHIHGDSSFVTKSDGEVLVRSNYTIASDTITISDYGTGEYTCPDMKGKYKINLNGDNLILTLIDDPCEGRANSLSGIKWIKASK